MSVVRLSDDQWTDIIRGSRERAGPGAGATSPVPARTGDLVSSGRTARPTSETRAAKPKRPTGPRVAYVVGLEADAPNEDWGVFEGGLDALVQSFQPAPVMTHVELLLPPAEASASARGGGGGGGEGEERINFATYLGKRADWGTQFGDAEDFYLGKNFDAWRATPVVAWDAANRLRDECELEHVHTPYAPVLRLYNYPFSIPPLRSLAWTIDDSPKTPAHCAALSARILRRALPETELPMSSAWYGPSTLFLEMTREERMRTYSRQLNDVGELRATAEVEEDETDAELGEQALLRGSDGDVRELTQHACHLGTEKLARKAIDAAVNHDPTMARMWQKNLAKALMRWAHVRGSAEGHPRVAEEKERERDEAW